MIREVQNAICASEIPRSLYRTAETMFRTTNGRPIAKYKLGTHRRGERNLSVIGFYIFFMPGNPTIC